MKFRKEKRSGPPTVQMASLMDIVFLLLCFFITTSVFSQWEKEVQISLPTAEKADVPIRNAEETIFNLDAEGRVTLNGKTLTPEEISTRLRNISKGQKLLYGEGFSGVPVIIRADKAVPYEKLMSLIDLCRAEGVWNFSLATEDPDKGK